MAFLNGDKIYTAKNRILAYSKPDFGASVWDIQDDGVDIPGELPFFRALGYEVKVGEVTFVQVRNVGTPETWWLDQSDISKTPILTETEQKKAEKQAIIEQISEPSVSANLTASSGAISSKSWLKYVLIGLTVVLVGVVIYVILVRNKAKKLATNVVPIVSNGIGRKNKN